MVKMDACKSYGRSLPINFHTLIKEKTNPQNLSLILLAANSCGQKHKVGRKHRVALIATASNSIWENKTACGRKLSVKCIGPLNRAPHPCKPNEVLVEIVEHCPHCHETLNLSEEGFAEIANLDAGIVKIEYHE
ncbi:putative EG45-like domain containing protein 1 [Morella rubra]|uniref:Putative EG45-like domain containing protein 1 n=1 Tax=Morella rubra TaxID=262757 RepID=A0A6A1W842_9ROSI|nr:putative EG45-like domain containing protein 1 [Morella rubra]